MEIITIFLSVMQELWQACIILMLLLISMIIIIWGCMTHSRLLLSFSFVLIICWGYATYAFASPLRPYTPGGSPCAGACSQEWAASLADVPMGIPERIMIPAGSIVHWMSYAKNGVPYGGPDAAVLMTNEPGEGYVFYRDDQQYLFVKLDVCQNWAIVSMPPVIEAINWDMPLRASVWPLWWPSSFWLGGYIEDVDGPVGPPVEPLQPLPPVWPPIPPEPPVPPTPPLPPVPLPWAIWPMLMGLMGLYAVRKYNAG